MGEGLGAKRARTSHRTPVSPIPPPAPSSSPPPRSYTLGPSEEPRLARGASRAAAGPRQIRTGSGIPRAQGQSGRAAGCRGGSTVQKAKTAAWAISTPNIPLQLPNFLRPAGLPAGVSLNPAWDSGSPVTCGRAGRGRAAERCGAGSPPPPLRRGRARGRARAGRAGRCPPRSPRQCQGGLGLCGHLPRSPLPAAGGRGIFSIASLYSSPKVSPTYLFICRRAPRCRRAARAAPRRAERWKRLGIAAGRAER